MRENHAMTDAENAMTMRIQGLIVTIQGPYKVTRIEYKVIRWSEGRIQGYRVNTRMVR